MKMQRFFGDKPVNLWGNWDLNRSLFDEWGKNVFTDNFISNFFNNDAVSSLGFSRLGLFEPSVDVVEEDDKFVVTAEIPGIDINDVDINIDDNILTIKGEKKSETKKETSQYLRTERISGSFERRFVIPSEIQQDKVEASYKNGVLKIELPRAPTESAKKINVKIEE